MPLEGSASYSEIAQFTRLPPPVVKRILRHAFTLRVFAPVQDDVDRVQHTANSIFVAKNPDVKALYSLSLNQSMPGFLKLGEALRAYSLDKEELSQRPGETALARALYNPLGNSDLADKTFFDFLESDGDGGQRKIFSQAVCKARAKTTPPIY